MNGQIVIAEGLARALSGYTVNQASWLIKNGEDVRKVINGQAKIVPVDTVVAIEETFDPNVKIGRDILHWRPGYKAVYPELHNLAPIYLDVRRIRMWWHEGQDQHVKGTVIHNYLLKSGILEICLGMWELEAIQKKGLGFLKHFFTDPAPPKRPQKMSWLFGWKSIARSNQFGLDRLFVPYLFETKNDVEIGWRRVDSDVFHECPALLFAA